MHRGSDWGEGGSLATPQGNGHERDKLQFGDDDTFILDMFGAVLYPGDEPAKVVTNQITLLLEPALNLTRCWCWRSSAHCASMIMAHLTLGRCQFPDFAAWMEAE